MPSQLLHHRVPHATDKPMFHFSRATFRQMRVFEHTHYCFLCGGSAGFIPDADGMPINHTENTEGPMKKHDASHAAYVLGDANKYHSAEDWIHAKRPSDFPVYITVQGIVLYV